jgi:hypothetical protein
MPGAANASVLLQTLDDTWERCGSGRAIRVVPTSLEATANEWGSDTATFDLKRSPGTIWPDIAAFAPTIIEIGGVPVWSGRTGDTPTKDGRDFVINVQCRGWQYHLDDDVYQRAYVHSKLSDYKDVRSIPTVTLGANSAAAAGQVSNDNGIALIWPSGTPWLVGSIVGVVLDLGPYSTAAAISLDYETSNNTASMYFFVRNMATPDYSGTATSDAYANPLTTMGASGTVSANFGVARRYVHLFMFANPAATPGGDVWVKVTRAQVFTDTAYRSGGDSVLKASTVISDAVDRATMLLSDDRSQITPSTFSIPDFALSRHRSPRETWETVNAFHNWKSKIDIERRPVYGPRPTAAELEVGAWSGAEFLDSSANSGDEIYNRAIGEGTASDGTRIVVDGVPTLPDPSFEVGVAGWSVTNGTFARDTFTFNSAPASGRWSPSATSRLTGTFDGTFRRGFTYKLTFAAQNINGTVDWGGQQSSLVIGRFWGTVSLFWTPTADTAGATIVLTQGFSGGSYVDDFELTVVADPTLVGRRRFQRTKTIEPSFRITTDVAAQLNDTFVRGHQTTPLKGDLNVSPGGCRQVIGGQPVHPSILLTKTLELMRLSHRIDPDTGAVGRSGTMVSVRYTNRDQTSKVGLDDPSRRNFDALMARLDSVQGAS